jgi:DNA polymerase-3 subunit delta'
VAWAKVRGHEAQLRAFEQAWRRGRLAHAYLFVGPAGVGKRPFAHELAKALLCEALPAGRLEACDRCPSCILAEAGNHPDLFTLSRPEQGNELSIEALRELCRGFVLKSARGRGKVAILDDADDLSEAAANCFLKTLEEPPPRSVFILLGTGRERQLPTIVSRCQVVRFAALPEALVSELLRQEPAVDPDLVPWLARLAEGSPGQARLLADPALWAFRRRLLEGLARQPPDTVALGRQWQELAEEAGKEAAAQRRRAGLVLRLLIASLHDALRVSLGETPRLADPEELALLRGLASRLGPDQILQLIERCLEADEQLRWYVQVVLVLEGLLDALGQLLREQASAPVLSEPEA